MELLPILDDRVLGETLTDDGTDDKAPRVPGGCRGTVQS
jgi:hypothetical protein